MALDLLHDCTFTGPAFPEPFVRFEFEKELTKAGLLPKTTGSEGSKLQESWESYRRKLRELAAKGGPIRVRNLVIEPLVARLGYSSLAPASDVQTREGKEAGGYLLTTTDNKSKIRVWCTEAEEDLDAPAKRGAAYRYSHVRIAQRVLLACGERLGMITNGVELRLLISDPARPDSQIEIAIDTSWKRSRSVPDSYRLVLGLASPKGQQALPDLVDKARLQQARVTKELRVQSRKAIEGFIQEILDHPQNQPLLSEERDTAQLARSLWHEGLITVYRLLFILKLEASDDPARAFSFASSSLWRNSFSPTVALAPFVRNVLDEGIETGRVLEDGLRAIFRMFAEGLQCTELVVKPLGGSLFGEHATPLLSKLHWGERGVALLLDRLLWTIKKGSTARERVHYGPLNVEDLGRVYEALLELDPGIATESMARLRRQKLEVVVPIAQGEKYRPVKAVATDELPDADEDDGDEDDSETSSKKTKVEWIEQIPAGRFYLRVGLGRKSTGSYYTPHSFVRFLVQETLGPQVAERSPNDDPQPVEILKLKILDPAMGSGHFLVEACRFLGEKLYEACRLCDERALAAEDHAETVKDAEERVAALAEAQNYRQRVLDLPDPDDELVKYLPSHAPEGLESGLSQRKAHALCRRLVAVHCLYGVDKNVLAVELAKLSLWIESHAEGLPLTFLDHRLIVGDSLTGPFFHHLLTYPGSKEPIEDLFSQGLRERFTQALGNALRHVRDLEATVGSTIAEVEAKQAVKARLDRALAPFKIVAAAWAGGVMLGQADCDDIGYVQLVREISHTGDLPESLADGTRLLQMIARGLGVEAIAGGRNNMFVQLSANQHGTALPYDLTFAEVFFPYGTVAESQGFDAVLGNPPWDKLRAEKRELLGSLDIEFLMGKEFEGAGLSEQEVIARLKDFPEALSLEEYSQGVKTLFAENFLTNKSQQQVLQAAGNTDLYRLFAIRTSDFASGSGQIGMVFGGGAAKNPADAPLRKFLFARFPISIFAHYLNLQQLFDGASSRIGFTVVASSKAHTNVRVARDLMAIDELMFIQDIRDRKSINDQLQETGSLYTVSLFTRKTIRLTSYLNTLGIILGNDMDRTSASRILVPISRLIPGETDGRLPKNRHLLTEKKYLVSYQGRSMGQFDHLPLEKAGKWEPAADLAMPIKNATRDIALRAQFYRLAIRATPGHPKTNARSLVACMLPPGCAATNSLLLERSPELRPNTAAVLALGILNSRVMDYQIRPHIQSNLNKALLAQCEIGELEPLVKRLIVHFALAALKHKDFDFLREEQNLPVVYQVSVAPQVLIDVLMAFSMGIPRPMFDQILSHFTRQESRNPQRLECLEIFDKFHSEDVMEFASMYDPHWDIPLNEDLPKPVIDLPIPEASTEIADQQPSLFVDTDAR